MGAEDLRIEMQRNLTDSTGLAERARRDLAQMTAERDGFEQQWKAQISQELTLRTRTLSDASENLRKAILRRELVDLRAERGLSWSQDLGRFGHAVRRAANHTGADQCAARSETRTSRPMPATSTPAKAAIKFDTFPFVQYGVPGAPCAQSADGFSGGQETQRESVVMQGDGRNGVFWRRALPS
jgi:hypothetical protein